jgi:hypothetical protein
MIILPILIIVPHHLVSKISTHLRAHQASKPAWVVQGVLARSSRPGYPAGKKGSDLLISNLVVEEWLESLQSQLTVPHNTSVSVLCLLHDAQFTLYQSNLLDQYKHAGLQVATADVKEKNQPLTEEERGRITRAFDLLQKPVLVQGSSGKGRTETVVKLLQAHISSKSASQAGVGDSQGRSAREMR